jgi:uncharacterized protein YukE
MAGAVGGELSTLNTLYTTLGNAAADITRIAGDIDSSLENTIWTGANSEKFRGQWADFKPTLTPRLVEALEDAKRDIQIQHNQLAEATGEPDRI